MKSEESKPAQKSKTYEIFTETTGAAASGAVVGHVVAHTLAHSALAACTVSCAPAMLLGGAVFGVAYFIKKCMED
jgi:hypothetical protein